MKLTVYKGITLSLTAMLAFSCASSPKTTEKNINTTTDTEKTSQEIAESVNIPSEEELYKQKIAETNLSLLSIPKQTTKNKIFTEAYVLKATDANENPLDSIEITVIYPAGRRNGEIVFDETVITTDSEGVASFLPPLPEFSCNSEISFFLKGNTENAEIARLAAEHAIKAEYKVLTNQKSAGGTLAIVDFKRDGTAITSNPISSSNLLMALMKLGFTKIGNAPQEVIEAVIKGDESKIHERAKTIAPSFIIFGTVKIVSMEKADEGFSYTLTGSIRVMDSKTGNITFLTEKTISNTEKNDWNSLANARKILGDQLAQELLYGI